MRRARIGGFTVIELMITILVAAVLVALAAPLYKEVRERSIVLGATGDLAAAFQQAKQEAAKRNDFVTVSVRGGGTPAVPWCIGVQSGATGCDCLNATCDINQVNATQLNGARLLAAADFNDTGGGGSTDVTIDPRLGMIRNLGSGGSLVLRSPSDSWDFRLKFNLSSTAQTSLCSPTGGRRLSENSSCP